ncbi:MAG: IS30 family transposase [Devosia sp.]|nr:IS30 family transposase [Devosia sp.]
MSHRPGLDQRPIEAALRTVPRHWEADLMAFSRSGQNFLMLHERMSRILVGTRLASKHAGPVAETIRAVLEPLPPLLRQTLTFDNGTEFARHHELNPLGLATYFCDPHAHGRRAASRMPSGACDAFCHERPISPKSTKPSSPVSLQSITIHLDAASAGKHQPKSFSNQVLHFKRESTSPLSRG